MVNPRKLVKKPDAPVIKTHASCTLFCPLFEHQKHTDVCTLLRAKRVCRVNCSQYFEFAKKNEESVRTVLTKYRPLILNSLKDNKTTEELFKSVMPKGDNICEYCAKAFRFEGALKRHLKKKHRREKEESRRSRIR